MEKNKFIFINDDNISDNLHINNQNENEHIILLDYDTYISKISSSYKNNSSNINDQFIKDFSRASYKINNITENNIYTFIDYFEFLLYQLNFDFSEFLMLCTQAVMGCPLEILYKTIYNKNIYIGELKNIDNNTKNIKKKNKLNKNIDSNFNNTLKFNIFNTKNDIYLLVNKTLRYFYVNNIGVDITVNLVDVNIYIPFYTKEKIIITYKILRNK
tara:strand:+ start:1281 stop:1925 length:645 start_codon:yes stop_codon:yes gene_type:complete